MATTRVSLSVQHPIEVGNVDVTLTVRRGSRLLGRLDVSKGGIDWTPANARKTLKAGWEAFDEWMKS